MSATTAAPGVGRDALREPPVPGSTLVRVELRKAVDTRAGIWLLALLAVLVTAASVLLGAFGEQAENGFDDFFRLVQAPIGLLLPVLAVLSVTSEWSQRTALTTFTLVPDRRSVVAAKLVALVVLTLVVTAFGTLVAASSHLVWGGDDSSSFGVMTLLETFVGQMVTVSMGLAFGLLIRASTPALVLSFALPVVLGVVWSLVDAPADPTRWLDPGQAFAPLLDGGVSAVEWARAATATALWVLLPLMAGLVRLSRSDIK